MIICGIDYSLNSPAIFILDTNKPNFENCGIHFIAQTKKQVGKIATGQFSSFTGYALPEYSCPEERYFLNAEWVSKIMKQENVEVVFMEGYSFASNQSLVRDISENAGCAKMALWLMKIPVILVPPTSLKKWWSGYGSSKKEQMFDAFIARGFPDFRYFLNKGVSVASPINDIIDSHALALYGAEQHGFFDKDPMYGRKDLSPVVKNKKNKALQLSDDLLIN